jgi:hypothetical protein
MPNFLLVETVSNMALQKISQSDKCWDGYEYPLLNSNDNDEDDND